jgi:hypothetical protein
MLRMVRSARRKLLREGPTISTKLLFAVSAARMLTEPFEPCTLLAAAHEEGSLAPSIDYVLLPDSRPIGLKGHYFDGNEQALTDAIVRWLAERKL